MRIQKINNIGEYSYLISRFLSKGTVSNNYMLPNEVADLINSGSLSECHNESNCFFLVEKAGGVIRVYYLLNDLSKPVTIEYGKGLVAEILFRGNAGEPTKEINYLVNCGFKINLQRDQYTAPIHQYNESEPVFAKTEDVVKKAIGMFNAMFDRFSGDYIDPEQATSLYKTKSLLCAHDRQGLLQGALHISITGRNAWVSHLAVDKHCRGIGVATKLMEMFITYAANHECKRLMLWVQHQNKAALALYLKYGFNYANKSAISLIKE